MSWGDGMSDGGDDEELLSSVLDLVVRGLPEEGSAVGGRDDVLKKDRARTLCRVFLQGGKGEGAGQLVRVCMVYGDRMMKQIMGKGVGRGKEKRCRLGKIRA